MWKTWPGTPLITMILMTKIIAFFFREGDLKILTTIFAPKEIFARYRAKFAGAETRGDYLARKASIKLANKGKRGGRREAKKKASKHQNTQAEKLQDAEKLTWKAQN